MPTYYFLPTRNVFGEGAVQEIGTLFGSLHASRAMIVTDKFLAQSGRQRRSLGFWRSRGFSRWFLTGQNPTPPTRT